MPDKILLLKFFSSVDFPLCSIIVAVIIFFLIGRYTWKIGGFDACESARIEEITVSEDSVRIMGTSSSFIPRGFIGYIYEEEANALYIGVNFDSFFGMFELGRFDITIPTKNEITEVYLKTADGEKLIWRANGEDKK